MSQLQPTVVEAEVVPLTVIAPRRGVSAELMELAAQL